MFNPKPVITRLPIHDDQICLVIDDVMLNPTAWVSEAVARRDQFRAAGVNAYPGIELAMPVEITQALVDFFALYVNRHFGIRRIHSSHSRLALVTQAPDTLQPRQCICHRDGVNVAPANRMLASVVYLQTEDLGGTSFYRPRRSPQETAQLIHDSAVMPMDSFTQKYGIARGYLTESNEWFEKTASVPAKFNRMIAYDGMVFHSGDIRQPERMSPDPATGRLSLNGFFTGRRRLA